MRTYALSPWLTSFLVHLSFVVAFLVLTLFKPAVKETFEVPIEIQAPPVEAQNLKEITKKTEVVLKSVNEAVPDFKKSSRQVFGANKNSYTDQSNAEGIEAKRGNTLTKAADNEVLTDSDADSLPEPTEEYLVSEMPSVFSEVRPEYPSEARKKGLEGNVVLDVLIDDKGQVREARVIEGPQEFRAGAIAAMQKFKFRPAKVDQKPVAVRIRYTLKFQLEY
jgi:TonB family protein